jgi:hypothetical protein
MHLRTRLAALIAGDWSGLLRRFRFAGHGNLRGRV